jgi:hypothetical protein
MLEFLVGDSCMDKCDQQGWECGSKKDCYLMSMDYSFHLFMYKRGG